MIAGTTAVRNHPNSGTLGLVRKDVPSLAKPSKSVARPEMKLNMSTTRSNQHGLDFRFSEGRIITASLCPQNEECNDELDKHANNNGMPFDHLPVSRCRIETAKQDYESK